MADKQSIKSLQEKLSQGKITRRKFIAGLSALGVSTVLSPTLLATPVFASTPKKGGLLRMGIGDFATTDSLDPVMTYTRMQVYLNLQLRNNLIEVERGGKLIPELAESWEATPDAKKWTFKLRKGIEFHNGKTLDAQDVIFSFQRHIGEGSKSAAKALLGSVTDIKADGKYTVIFILDQGNVDFPAITTDFPLSITPAGTTDFDKGIGTGPYMLKSFVPGVSSITKKNPNYWKEGRGHFDEVKILGIADVGARNNALLNEQVDVIPFCDPKTATLLGKKENINILRTHGKMHYLFPMRTDLAPFDNNDVRLALKHAIDREHVLKIILRGYGSLGNDQPISSPYRFYSSELPQRKYDPEKAKFYLKKAGIGDYPFKLHVADLPFSGAVDTAVLYQQHAAKAGIKIQVVREPDDGFWNDVWMKKPWFVSRWTGRATENIMLSTAYSNESSWNETYFKHERFEQLLKSARVEFDENKRRELYTEICRIIRDEGGAVIPVFADFIDAANKKLRFAERSSEWELDGCRIAERWWFES